MEELAMRPLPLGQPGAAVLIGRSGEGQRGWNWRLWFSVHWVSSLTLWWEAQLCLAGQCPILVPAHPCPLQLAVCTRVAPAAIPGKMDTRRDRANPVSSAPEHDLSSDPGQNWQRTAHQVIQSRNGCWTAAQGVQEVDGCEEWNSTPNLWNEGVPGRSALQTQLLLLHLPLVPAFYSSSGEDFKLSHFCKHFSLETFS